MITVSSIIQKKISRTFRIDPNLCPVFLSERPEFGDYSTNCAFVLAKERGTSPFLIAEDLRKEIESKKLLAPYCDRVEVKNGYLNFFLSDKFLVQCHADWGSCIAPLKSTKKSKCVVIDFSSPNIGKTLSVAHIRSTILGESLSRIYEHLGWRVIRDNHLGDWGMLAAKLIAAYKLYGRKPLLRVTIADMQKWYVRFTTSEKDHPELINRAKQETVALQGENSESMQIWKALRTASLREFHRLYKILEVRFDHEFGESHYRELSSQLVPQLVRKGIAKRSQGAIIVSLDEYGLPPILVQKSDDASLYATNDFATTVFRYKKWKPDLSLYVVANEQSLYFEQLFRAFEKYRLSPGTKLVHVKFGMIRGADGKKLSTRRGAFISLEELLQKATQRAQRIAKKKNPLLKQNELIRVAAAVGIGALKYQDLSQNRNTDIMFDWEKMLSLQGNSAPYIQYTYARLASILRKARLKPISSSKFVFGEEEGLLMRKCVQFGEVVEKSASEYAPNIIANYVYDLCSLINGFYERIPILKSEEPQRSVRLAVIKHASETIKASLYLLGISVMNKM